MRVACSLYATAFGSFAVSLFESSTGTTPDTWVEPGVAVGVVPVFLRVNFRGDKDATLVEIVITGLKIAVLLVLIAFGLGSGTGFTPPFNDVKCQLVACRSSRWSMP